MNETFESLERFGQVFLPKSAKTGLLTVARDTTNNRKVVGFALSEKFAPKRNLGNGPQLDAIYDFVYDLQMRFYDTPESKNESLHSLAWLKLLAVSEEYAGCGIASQLVKENEHTVAQVSVSELLKLHG